MLKHILIESGTGTELKIDSRTRTFKIFGTVTDKGISIHKKWKSQKLLFKRKLNPEQ